LGLISAAKVRPFPQPCKHWVWKNAMEDEMDNELVFIILNNFVQNTGVEKWLSEGRS